MEPENDLESKRPLESQKPDPIPKKKRKQNTNPFESLDLSIGEEQNSESDKNCRAKKTSIHNWIEVQKQTLSRPLTVAVSNHTKLNNFYSHRSIQKYLRYLITETCPNPMWLQIKRQSQVKSICYIDVEIEGRLINKMMGFSAKVEDEKGEKQEQEQIKCQLPFLRSLHNPDSKAVFRKVPIVRQNLWSYLFCYEEQLAKLQKNSLPARRNSSELNGQLDEALIKRYRSYTLTPNQLKFNLYPMPNLPAYKDYARLPQKQTGETLQKPELSEKNWANKILCIDCEMVSTEKGFQLARATICDFNGKMIYDEFFRPPNEVQNYNTQFSGITEELLSKTTNTIEANLHPKLFQLITPETILVGHSLENDLHAMKFIHDRVIDTSVIFQRKNGTKMKLRTLSEKVLERKIQHETHDSLEDCIATLDLLKTKVHSDIESELLNEEKQEVQYHFLKEVQQRQYLKKRRLLVVDDDIDELRKYSDFCFEKVHPNSSAKQRLSLIVDSYLNPKIIEDLQGEQKPNPLDLIFTRIEKKEEAEWECHYLQLESALKNLYDNLQPGTLIFLNCQINTNIRIVDEGIDIISDRPYCLISAKN